MKIYYRTAILAIGFFWVISGTLEAGTIPTGQDVGALGNVIEGVRARDEAVKRLLNKDVPLSIDDSSIAEDEKTAGKFTGKDEATEKKIFIETIVIDGVTVLGDDILKPIVTKYLKRELSFEDFTKLTESITAEYRKKGYVTSVAYLPPQQIKNNTLEIDVAEGKVGGINLSGNKFFGPDLLYGYIEMEQGDIFNYDVLKSNINYINQHPDRRGKVVLSRGENKGETDIDVIVEDRLPLHVTLGYNNYNSQYLERNKYTVELKSTNFLGADHIVSVEAQFGEDDKYELHSARYTAPLSPDSEIGGYYIHVYQALGRSMGDLKIRGSGDIISLYSSRKFIDSNNFTMKANAGFEYKDICNDALDRPLSEDNIRIAKLGLDLDVKDRLYGRTIVTHEFDLGIEDILGGLAEKDPLSSRAGAGGKFFRTVTNVARIQSLPWSMSIMLRGAMQLTAYNLVSSEQFNIGGATTVRGYPVSEYAGDKGFTETAELYMPLYFIPKTTVVPFTKTTYFDAFRFLVFFDWGRVVNNHPLSGEPHREKLYSVGPGIRFDIPDHVSISFDYGFALGQKASDGSKSAGYIETKLYF